MVEVVHIKADKSLPENGNHVEIVPVRDGYAANGSVAYIEPTPQMVAFTPDTFASLDDAIQASCDWALTHSVPYVYVRETP